MKYLYKISITFTALLLIFSSFLFYPNSSLKAKAQSQDFVVLSHTKKEMKIGDEFFLLSFTFSGKQPTFKSSRSSIASVSRYGVISAKKPGTVRITASVSGHEAYCMITVLPTTISLSHTKIHLYRNQTLQLVATTSTGHIPTFKSSKSSVVSVDANGLITAKKHGTALIKVKCDGVTETCEVTVLKPTIQLSATKITLVPGQCFKLKAFVSSNNPVTWSVSNINVLSVDCYGNVTARQKGKAYVYASEDGTKVSCIVQVKNPS